MAYFILINKRGSSPSRSDPTGLIPPASVGQTPLQNTPSPSQSNTVPDGNSFNPDGIGAWFETVFRDTASPGADPYQSSSVQRQGGMIL